MPNAVAFCREAHPPPLAFGPPTFQGGRGSRESGAWLHQTYENWFYSRDRLWFQSTHCLRVPSYWLWSELAPQRTRGARRSPPPNAGRASLSHPHGAHLERAAERENTSGAARALTETLLICARRRDARPFGIFLTLYLEATTVSSDKENSVFNICLPFCH